MKTIAQDLRVGDVFVTPVNLRGAEIASIAMVEGQIVCYMTGHPKGATKMHSPLDFEMEVNRPVVMDETVLYEADCTCVLLGKATCRAHSRI